MHRIQTNSWDRCMPWYAMQCKGSCSVVLKADQPEA